MTGTTQQKIKEFTGNGKETTSHSPRLRSGLKPADNKRMNSNQTSSDPVRTPVIHAGASMCELGRGIFAPMKTPKQYEAEIESLTAMNLKLQIELTKALEAVSEAHRKSIQQADSRWSFNIDRHLARGVSADAYRCCISVIADCARDSANAATTRGLIIRVSTEFGATYREVESEVERISKAA